MIGNILDNTTELYMIKYAFGEIFSSGGATLCKDPSDQSVSGIGLLISKLFQLFHHHHSTPALKTQLRNSLFTKMSLLELIQ